jgi:hypothetical protein
MCAQQTNSPPNLENLRKQAKGLLKQLKSTDADAVSRLKRGLPRLSSTADGDVPDAGVTLQEVQHVIAVEQGFGNWKQVLAAAGEERPRRQRRTLHVRPGMPNLVQEAEWLLWMVERQEHWALRRMRKHPRLAPMSEAQIAEAGVTLEDARQVVAADYGFDDWAELETEVGQLHPVSTFEDLAELEDDEIRQVIFRLGRDKLAVVFKAVSERFKDRFRACMSDAEWEALAAAMEELGPMPLSAVEAAQARVLQQYRTDDPLV